MLYFARVVDNRNFGQSGTIEVFLPQKNSENGLERYYQKDLKNSVTELQYLIQGNDENTMSTKFTFSCLVMSPMANGNNTGMFSIPQINTVGIVMEIENKKEWSSYRYIWLGGLYGCKLYGNNVMLPNDDTISDSFNYEDKALQSINDDSEEDNISDKDIIRKGEFIVKTKTSRVTDFENLIEKQIDLEQIPSDNTFVMNKNKISLRHNEYADNDKKNNFSDITFDKNNITIKRFTGESDDKRKEQIIKINNNEISIMFDNKNDSKKVTLSFDAEGNTNLETTGSVTVHSEGDMSFKTDKKFSIYSKQKLDIKTDDTANISAKTKTKIEGNGVDLGTQLKNISEHYKQTNTIGGPTNQALSPGNKMAADTDISQTSKGFI
jgi:hypothetical protein